MLRSRLTDVVHGSLPNARRVGAAHDHAVAAKVLAGLHIIGATLALIWLVLPHSPRAQEVGVACCIVYAYLIGAALLTWSGRVPPLALRIVVALTITLTISSAIYFSHATGSAFALFYLWATLYAFYFFSLAEAAFETALVGLSYSAVLLLSHSTNVWGEEAGRWWLTLATAVVSGGLVRLLTQGVRRSERRFRHGLDVSAVGVALVDEEGRFETANPALCALLGRSAEGLIGVSLVDVTAPEDRIELESRLREIRTGSERSVQIEQRCLLAGGFRAIVLVTLSQLSDERPFHALLQVQDVTAHRRTEEALRASEERYRLAFEKNPKPMWVFDIETLEFIAVNQAAIDSYGYSREEFLAATLRDIRPREDIPQLERALSERGGTTGLEARHCKKDGSLIDVEIFSNEVRIDGRRGRLVLSIDITERKRAERLLRHNADHDPLTGLLNRRRFEEELAQHIDAGQRGGDRCSVLVIDIDDLKYVNDCLGHAAGDGLLREVATSLRQRVRGADVLARIGGDEFAAILPATDESTAEHVAKDLLDHLRGTVWHGLRRTTASVGVATTRPGQRESADQLLVAADVAMYEAKDAGRNRIAISSGQASGVTWVEEIREAIDSGRLTLYAQPIVDLRTGEIAQEELLVRMIGRDGSLIPPAAFIPVAERFGLIHEIDRWVVSQGVRLARSGRRVEVNLSAHSIGERSVTAIVARELDNGFTGENLIFEITETAAAANFREVREFAERLTRLGCGFALDDFGTGFGSFSYLKHVPASILKIDMEFVRELARNPADQRVVKAIVSIAEGFGQRTIAEGVEDAVTLELLRDFGVHYAQGYFVGRPKPLILPSEGELAAAKRIVVPG